jgi:hypothetical protein
MVPSVITDRRLSFLARFGISFLRRVCRDRLTPQAERFLEKDKS